MDITTQFDLGQTVYGIANVPASVWVPCGFCAASGRVSGADGSSRLCPTCYGDRGLGEWRPTEWRVNATALTIGQVRVEATCSSGRDGEELFDNYKPHAGWSEAYMCVETGVGSGQIWLAENLFASRAEAEAACVERNTAEVAA